jgi:hypothetical protein
VSWVSCDLFFFFFFFFAELGIYQMGLEVELDFDKSCKVGLSPNTVLLSHRHSSNLAKRKGKGKSTRKVDLLSLKEDFIEINFGRSRSSSCTSILSRPVGQEGNIELKRGSIYQTSKEVREMKRTGTVDGGEILKCVIVVTALSLLELLTHYVGSDEDGPQEEISSDIFGSQTFVQHLFASLMQSHAHQMALMEFVSIRMTWINLLIL